MSSRCAHCTVRADRKLHFKAAGCLATTNGVFWAPTRSRAETDSSLHQPSSSSLSLSQSLSLPLSQSLVLSLRRQKRLDLSVKSAGGKETSEAARMSHESIQVNLNSQLECHSTPLQLTSAHSSSLKLASPHLSPSPELFAPSLAADSPVC